MTSDHRPRTRARHAAMLIAASVTVLLGLAGCGRQPSEQEIRTEIRQALDEQGFAWVQLAVSGRRVRLAGTPPAIGAGGRALRAAEAVSCETPLGATPCATDVSADFGTTIAGEDAWPQLELRLAAGVLTLEGSVPDVGSRRAALEAGLAAVAEGRVEEVVDLLHVMERTPRPGSEPLVDRVTRALGYCHAGRARVTDGEVHVSCRLRSGRADSVRGILATPLPAGTLARLQLMVAEPGTVSVGMVAR